MNIYQIPVTYTCHGFIYQKGITLEDAYDTVCEKLDKEQLCLADVQMTSVEELDVRPIIYVNQV